MKNGTINIPVGRILRLLTKALRLSKDGLNRDERRELGLGELNADDGYQTLSGVITDDIRLILLDELKFARGIINDASNSSAKPGKMAATFLGINAVGKGHGLR